MDPIDHKLLIDTLEDALRPADSNLTFAHGGSVTKQPNPADNFQGIIAAIEEALA